MRAQKNKPHIETLQKLLQTASPSTAEEIQVLINTSHTYTPKFLEEQIAEIHQRMTNNSERRARFTNARSKLEQYFNPSSAQTTPSANETPAKKTPPAPPPRSNSLPSPIAPLTSMSSFARDNVPSSSQPGMSAMAYKNMLNQNRRRSAMKTKNTRMNKTNVHSTLQRLAELNANNTYNSNA